MAETTPGQRQRHSLPRRVPWRILVFQRGGDRAVTQEPAPRPGPTRRLSIGPASAQKRWNLLVLCVATVVLSATMFAARAELGSLEVRIFRAVNDLPQGLYAVVWPFMQYGTFSRFRPSR
jgi:hypothetical protein